MLLTGIRAKLAISNYIKAYPGNPQDGFRLLDLIRSETSEPNPAFHGVLSDEDFSSALSTVQAAENTLPSVVANLEKKALKKWVLPQGGKIATADIVSKIGVYYDNAKRTVKWLDYYSFRKDMDKAVNAVCPSLFAEMSKYADSHHLCNTKQELFKLAYQPRGGHAGWDGDFKRSLKSQFILILKSWQSTTASDSYPAFAGARLKDSKTRTIFMTSIREMINAQYCVGYVLDYLATSAFTRHRSDVDVENDIFHATNAGCSFSVASDYEAMDTTFTLQMAIYTFRWFAEHLQIPVARIRLGITYLEKCFKSPVIISREMIMIGLHCLFSGLPITHDIENGCNMLIHIRAIYELSCKNDMRISVLPLSLAKKYAKSRYPVIIFLETNGDYSAAIIRCIRDSREHVRALALGYAYYHKLVAEYCGCVVNLEKTVMSSDYIDYCKRIYLFASSSLPSPSYIIKDNARVGTSGKRSYYSLLKALNSLYHPEKLPKFSARASLLLWFCEIYDNAFGHPLWWKTLCALNTKTTRLGQLVREEICNVTDELVNDYSQESVTYTSLLYGRFNLDNSPTWYYLKKMMHI